IKLNTVKQYFELLLDRKKKLTNGIKLDYKIREGHIFREIVNQAKYDDADYILMGTHGVSGFEEFWIGSNAFRVVTHADCPVITISYGYQVNEISKIVLPIDISVFTRAKVPVVADIAAKLNAEVHILSVSETDKDGVMEKINHFAKQTIEFLENKNITCISNSIIGENNTDSTIEYAQKINAQLIAIMTEQTENTRNFWINSSYAQQMVNHSSIPVMSIRMSNLLKND
ncbi:universal stress protein, partial [Bacteroidota bacterium]